MVGSRQVSHRSSSGDIYNLFCRKQAESESGPGMDFWNL